jgi:hypothetical protein
MSRIIGISGRKQSGKSTTANYINGDILSRRDMVKGFGLDDEGKLLITTLMADGSEAVGEFDVCRRDQDFIAYAEKEMWPYVKVYHFADTLKNLAVELFGIQPHQVFGTDSDKNELINYSWENMPTETNKTGDMTAREFLQYFGTSVVRSINTNAWVQATIKRITSENTGVAVIPDVRFPNEVQAIKHAGGIVIRMERNPFDCSHTCESALDRDKFDWNEFDVIIPNSATTIPMLVEELSNISHLWR